MPTTGVVQPFLFQEELAVLLSRLKMSSGCSLGLNPLCLKALKDLTQPEQRGLGVCDVLQVDRSFLCPTGSPTRVRWVWAVPVRVLTAECCKPGVPPALSAKPEGRLASLAFASANVLQSWPEWDQLPASVTPPVPLPPAQGRETSQNH